LNIGFSRFSTPQPPPKGEILRFAKNLLAVVSPFGGGWGGGLRKAQIFNFMALWRKLWAIQNLLENLSKLVCAFPPKGEILRFAKNLLAVVSPFGGGWGGGLRKAQIFNFMALWRKLWAIQNLLENLSKLVCAFPPKGEILRFAKNLLAVVSPFGGGWGVDYARHKSLILSSVSQIDDNAK